MTMGSCPDRWADPAVRQALGQDRVSTAGDRGLERFHQELQAFARATLRQNNGLEPTWRLGVGWTWGWLDLGLAGYALDASHLFGLACPRPDRRLPHEGRGLAGGVAGQEVR